MLLPSLDFVIENHLAAEFIGTSLVVEMVELLPSLLLAIVPAAASTDTSEPSRSMVCLLRDPQSWSAQLFLGNGEGGLFVDEAENRLIDELLRFLGR